MSGWVLIGLVLVIALVVIANEVLAGRLKQIFARKLAKAKTRGESDYFIKFTDPNGKRHNLSARKMDCGPDTMHPPHLFFYLSFLTGPSDSIIAFEKLFGGASKQRPSLTVVRPDATEVLFFDLLLTRVELSHVVEDTVVLEFVCGRYRDRVESKHRLRHETRQVRRRCHGSRRCGTEKNG